MSDVFEPDVTIAIIKSPLSLKEARKLESGWNTSVNNRVTTYMKNRPKQSVYEPQLRFEANAVEYVNYLSSQTLSSGKPNKTLSNRIPIFGPRFVPPSYSHYQRRNSAGKMTPEVMYLRPLNIVHPFYYPQLAHCPSCGSKNIKWNGWTATGARELHGVHSEERALGFQLNCEDCKQARTKLENPNSMQFAFATTSHEFWASWEHFRIPPGIPYFMNRCGLTRDLFNLIIELRLSYTSLGLAEHIHQLHLLEYYQRGLQYLHYFGNTTTPPGTEPTELEAVSPPGDPDKYNDTSISGDTISAVYLQWVERTRQPESEQHLRTLTGISLSFDATLKVKKKAVTTDSQLKRSEVIGGGILSTLDEKSRILAWRFCQTQSNVEIVELLEGIKRRCDGLGVPYPEIVIADNCCSVCNSVKCVFPDIYMGLDVYHCANRYLSTVVDGNRNPLKSRIRGDLTNAILVHRAEAGTPAEYRSKEDQETRVKEVYKHYSDLGGAWTAASAKVHQDQLAHIRKGCLSRPRHDIASDGSRIEGSHKHWNNIMRSFASGLEMMAALSHDHVARYNVRRSRTAAAAEADIYEDFDISTHGSHHLRLVDFFNVQWNAQLQKPRNQSAAVHLRPLPVFRNVESGEHFGLVQSNHTSTFGGLLSIKEEMEEDSLEVYTESDEAATAKMLGDLHIDPRLLSLPESFLAPSKANSIPGTIKTADSTATLTSPLHVKESGAGLSVGPEPIVPAANDPIDLTITEEEKTFTEARLSIKRKPEALADSDPVAGKRMRISAGSESNDESSRAATSSTSAPSTKRSTLDTYFSASTSLPPPKPHASASFKSSTTSDLPSSSTTTTMAATKTITIPQDLATPLPLPPGSKLTRSQLIFSLATSIDPHSLAISQGAEFYLFMDLREQHQWVSHSMTPKRWMGATALYNTELRRLNESKGFGTVEKNPRALMNKLADTENIIGARLKINNYASRSGDTAFWTRHCNAVPLFKPNAKKSSTKAPKLKTCTRCKMIMHPGGEGSPDNHKKAYCFDGVKQISKTPGETLPEWPQPKGIFSKGEDFNARTFLQTIHQLNHDIFMNQGSSDEDKMSYEAFVKELLTRTEKHDDGMVTFRLYKGLTVVGSLPDTYFVEVKGARCLRIDCLRDEQL